MTWHYSCQKQSLLIVVAAAAEVITFYFSSLRRHPSSHTHTKGFSPALPNRLVPDPRRGEGGSILYGFWSGSRLRFEGEGQPRTCGFTGRAVSSEEKNKTKNTSFDSVFQNPCCVSGRRGLYFVPVEILPLCGAVLQGPRCVFLSIKLPIFNIQGSFPKNDLTWEGSPEDEESKESEMTLSEVRGIVLLFVCSVSLSWNALLLDFISSLTSERVCLNLPIVIIRRDPLPSWHIGVTENRVLPAKEAHSSF